jgi:hypothetical protein
LEKFFPIIGKLTEIFSNHWKTGEKFFQSLEKSGGVFQPVEKMFPIIGKLGGWRRASGRAGGGGLFISPFAGGLGEWTGFSI